jgi:hypothetical protein
MNRDSVLKLVGERKGARFILGSVEVEESRADGCARGAWVVIVDVVVELIVELIVEVSSRSNMQEDRPTWMDVAQARVKQWIGRM